MSVVICAMRIELLCTYHKINNRGERDIKLVIDNLADFHFPHKTLFLLTICGVPARLFCHCSDPMQQNLW
jgi:hypothetical protein